MTPDRVLETMRAYFAERHPPEALEGFGGLSPRGLLKESLDVVDFVVYLEEELGREFDLTQVTRALSMERFDELAAAVAALLAE